ncbi:CHAT domain-containing protein [Geminocystis sp. NIES-3708]|uniref:CHAT domain-containing protein n=1 Tax=Geminocystis sp. NIES-3708 TaxID=1615909 RepID=UPI0008376467|nr:CHAT domain-containing protein [Geminocystis sp. NIES-3708]
MKIQPFFKLALLTFFFTVNFTVKSNKVLAFEMMTEAEIFYQKGDYSSAIETLKNIISQGKEKKDIISQSQSLINLALIYLHQQEFTLADSTIKKALSVVNQIDDQDKNKSKLLNFAFEIQAEVEMEIASPEIAIQTWKKSSKIAEKRGDISQFIYAEIKQTRALQELGFYRQALDKLTSIQSKLENAPQNIITAQAWLTLGEKLSTIGEFNQGEIALNKALEIAENYKQDSLIANIFIAQGNLAFLIKKENLDYRVNSINQSENYLENIDLFKNIEAGTYKSIIQNNKKQINKDLNNINNYYQKAINIQDVPEIKVIAKLTYLGLLINYNDLHNIDNVIDEILENINRISIKPNKNSINYRISLANNLLEIDAKKYTQFIIQQLKLAYQESNSINYNRGKSNALGNLGKLYFSLNNFKESQNLTSKALYFSQEIKASDLSYQWHWLLGKIARENNQRDKAISSYQSAVNILKNLRGDLAGINNDLEFDFRTNIEPIYREFVDLLLNDTATDEEIKLARNTIDSLQVAELDNFFRDACLDIKPINLEKIIDQETAIFYPIILEDRLEVIVSIGNKTLHHHSIKIDQKKINSEIDILTNNLSAENLQDLNSIQLSLYNLYNNIIEPVKEKLVSFQVKNLVFVADGNLKNIPMSALFDGNKYLIENYNIAVAPSLQLLPPENSKNSQQKVILSGLSDMNQENELGKTFDPLPQVAVEIKKINNIIPQSETLLNQEFTQNQLKKIINNSLSPIIHIATHGQFSSDKNSTFLLTWDEKIGIEELTSLFQNYNKKQPLELLVLSACQTAVGDKRATLGLAGISLKAGARTTVASLWPVVDESTQLLISDFYQQLNNPFISKAEALRKAQIDMIKHSQYSHPSYWSAFILIGNWL